MSESHAASRQPIDIEEFERKLRAPDAFDDDGEDPLAALARMVDGSAGDAPAAPPQPPRWSRSNPGASTEAPPVSWARVEPRATMNPPANDIAPPAVPLDDWDEDLRNWESELRGLSGAAPAAAPVPAEVAPAAASAAKPAPMPAVTDDFFDDYAIPPLEDAPSAVAPPVSAYSSDARFAPAPPHRESVNHPHDGRHGDAEPPDDDEAYADAAPPVKSGARKPMIWAGASALAILCVVGGALGVRGLTGGKKETPVILANSEPSKVQPDSAAAKTADPGGSVFDRRADQINGSRLVSNQEQPVDLGAQAARPRVVGSTGVTSAAPPPNPAAAASAPATANNNFFPEPKRVKTVSVRPDGSIIEGDATPPRAAPVPAPRPAAATPAAVPAPKPTTPKSTARIATTPKGNTPDGDGDTSSPAVSAARPKPSAPVVTGAKPAAKPVSNDNTASTGGGYSVQFAAAGSDGEARDKIAKVQAQYGSALSGHKAGVVKGEANGNTVYRVRVSGLSKESAAQICSKVKSSGGNCFVAGN